MALYKYEQHIKKSMSDAFDLKYDPGEKAANAGIYRCIECGDEIGIAKGHILPPQNHHQHPPLLGPIKWRLHVFAQQVKN